MTPDGQYPKAVIFDLGNTLVSYYQPAGFRPLLRQCLREAAAALRVAPDDRILERIYEQALILNREPADYATRPLEGRLRQLFQGWIDFDEASGQAACEAFLRPIFATARPDQDACRVLEALRRRGIKTAIVSNTPWGSSSQSWHEELHRLGLHDKV